MKQKTVQTRQSVLSVLGYEGSRSYLQGDELDATVPFAHLFRRGRETCGLRGVYTLRDPSSPRTVVPLVYVADAESAADADVIHRRVWNQDVAPFLLVETRRWVRLYSGFRYAPAKEGAAPASRGLLAEVGLDEIGVRLGALRADAIDSGALWSQHRSSLSLETRLDWHLLASLERLDRWLIEHDLAPQTAHALIGKYIYLHYLRARGLLSERRIREWGIEPATVFSRRATLKGLRQLVERLEEWLNGSIFPLALTGPEAPRRQHIERVAGTFAGDDPESGQTHLDFAAYDFSHIPVETLSVVYEQFLHKEGKGKERGAYYTPVPLIDFMLGELMDMHPLRRGMRVLDPACGSGAFLVQCYRMLVERARAENSRAPEPVELRRLLTEQIFGVDSDGDACRVAALSLALAMLDYVEPKKLERHPQFRLPSLHGQNIFQADFFDPDSSFRQRMGEQHFDWVVGNPPWIPEAAAGPARAWMDAHAAERPVGKNQLAEAFAWKAAEAAAPAGVVGLLLPAMTLFKTESAAFRARFFSEMNVSSVANFANLAEVLFAGRARLPAAAVFYAPLGNARAAEGAISTYAPLVANQEANRPSPSSRQNTWSLVVNAGEVRTVAREDAATGEFLPWKIAMWGSYRDARLLRRMDGRFPVLGAFAADQGLILSEGLQLRSRDATEAVEPIAEVIGKMRLDVKALRKQGPLFSFPARCLERIGRDEAYVRKRGGKQPLAVCRPPHVIVNAARNFAVYSGEFLIVPPTQIGIAGPPLRAALLKALSLYLSSDFTLYHQFLLSPQWGVQRAVSTLQTLRQLPVPLGSLGPEALARWADLHASLVDAHEETGSDDSTAPLFDVAPRSSKPADRRQQLRAQLNTEVNELLGLTRTERQLVADLVHVRMQLNDGKLGHEAVRAPTAKELGAYAATLKGELDGFLGEGADAHHRVTLFRDEQVGMIEVALVPREELAWASAVIQVDSAAGRQMAELRERLQRRHSQWLYFDRGLRVYEEKRVLLLKPMQRFHFTGSQALVDADEIIAETLSPGGV